MCCNVLSLNSNSFYEYQPVKVKQFFTESLVIYNYYAHKLSNNTVIEVEYLQYFSIITRAMYEI